jgi:hypothetical protein
MHNKSKPNDVPKCSCGREAVVRRNGRHYCEEHADEGVIRAIFSANAGD